MTEADPMSPAQREAMQKAWDLLTENFERVLLVVDFDIYEPSGPLQDARHGWWHGGTSAAIGMAEFAKDRVLHSPKRDNEPDDDSE